LLSELSSHLGDLSRIERFYLLSDGWAGVLSGRSELADFLAIAGGLPGETDPDVWGQATGALALMDKAIPDDLRPALASYARALVGPAFNYVGWERRNEDTERLRSLRAILLASLGTVGADDEVRTECARKHDAYLDGTAELDPDLASAIVAVVADSGGVEEYEAFLAKMRNPSTPQEEMRYLLALANFSDPALAERSFELAMSEIRVQNAPSLIMLLLANRANGAATWKRVVEHWDEINDKFPDTLVTRMLEGVRLICRDTALASEITSYLASHPVPSGDLVVAQTCERLGVNTALAGKLATTGGPVLAAATDRLGTAGAS
jgi:puromycin-sensitive aminopeptidase